RAIFYLWAAGRPIDVRIRSREFTHRYSAFADICAVSAVWGSPCGTFHGSTGDFYPHLYDRGRRYHGTHYNELPCVRFSPFRTGWPCGTRLDSKYGRDGFQTDPWLAG